MVPLLVIVVAVKLFDPSARVPADPVLTVAAERLLLSVRMPEVTVRVPPEENIKLVGAVGLVPGPVGAIITVSPLPKGDGGTPFASQLAGVPQVLLVTPVHVYVTPHPNPAQKTRIPATVHNFFMRYRPLLRRPCRANCLCIERDHSLAILHHKIYRFFAKKSFTIPEDPEEKSPYGIFIGEIRGKVEFTR
jgi:hypothetical protein